MFLSSRLFHSWVLTPVLVSSWVFFSSPLFTDRTSRVIESNSPLVAVDDSYTVHGQRALTPLDNDYDSDENPFFLYWATQPAHGSVTIASSTMLSYVAASGYVGSDSFTYTIRDTSGNFATGTIDVTDVNQSPVAVTDSYTVHGQLRISPTDNDYDPDNDGVSFKALETNPQHGTLTAFPNGVYNYVPAYGYVGSDSFTYSIQDGWGATATGTVNLSVVNLPPIAIPDFYVVHSNLTVWPAVNDIDPENDGFTFRYQTSNPLHGTLTGPAPGALTYWPNAGFSGFDSFTYSIFDDYGANGSGTVFLFVIQDSTTSLPPHGCACPDDPSGPSGFSPEAGGLRSEPTGPAGPSGPFAHDPVNLATGRETYTPDSDLIIYNPSGPNVNWQRSYLSDQALSDPSGYGSPGLSRGWVHNYDMRIQATSGSWGNLTLIYPNGATEALTPQLSGGSPTGAFTSVAGAPYIATGVSGSPTGVWQSVTVTWKDQTQWKFTQLSGGAYVLSQLTNRTGQSLDFSWNSNRALTQISDHGSSTTLLTLSYANGQLSTAIDVYDRKVSYGFSAVTSSAESMLQTVSQVVTSSTSNPPAHWTFAYASDKGGQLNTITVPSPTGTGNSTATINYDSTGRVSSLVDGNGNQRVYTYNSGTTGVQVKDASNNVALAWTQKFNSSGFNTGITDAATHSSTVAYVDGANPLKPTSVTDRNGHVTSYTYDSFGNVLTATSPRNITTTYTWDYTNFALGRLTSIQQGSKPATTATYYEPSGLIHTITRPEPNNGAGTTTTTLTYDSLGNVLTIVRPGNNAASTITTTLNYTTDGSYSQSAKVNQPITVTDNLSQVTHLRYDSQGRTISLTDALANETDFSYNIVGQSDTTTYPATGQTGSGHSHTTNAYRFPGGPLTTITSYDEANTQVRQITRAYGLEGELLSLSGSTEPVTNTYDALYRVKTLTDGNSHTTTYVYNSVGFVSSITMPGSEVTQFTSYDNAGNLLQRVDGNNVTTNYVYDDDESLLTDIEYPATTSLNVHFDYDSYGRRSAMSDSTGGQSYSYGNLDELLSVETTYTGLSAKTISYSYYPDGSRESMSTPAGSFSYSYDGASRPASMTNPSSETTSWSYGNNNWLSTQTLANGAVATYTHNALGQVTELLNQIGSTTISDFSSIAYDGVGNRTSVSASIPGATSLNGTTSYSNDSKNQITQEASTRNSGWTDNFVYDDAGNPTTFKGVTKSYNSNNQHSGTGFSYDSNGNPTTYGGTTLTFDPENRMTAYGSALTASYNGDGLRASKANSTTTTYFLYDGILPVVELDSSGSIAATITFGAAGLVSRRSGGTTVFYSFDSEGNVSQRSNSSGTVLSNYLFAAHGSILNGALSDPFGSKARFGYYTDPETGMQLLTHRYYDPSRGRFLTQDPIGFRGGVNLYSYVRDNPTNWIDPVGHDLWGVVGGGGAGAAVGGLGIMGSASYLFGVNDQGDKSSIGGAGSYGVAAGPDYASPSPPRNDPPGGFGAMFGAGGGGFWSNAKSFNDLAGDFSTTIIATPIGIGIEIDKSDSGIWIVSVAYGKGEGAGVFHYHTYTPCWSIWETKPTPKPRPLEK